MVVGLKSAAMVLLIDLGLKTMALMWLLVAGS